MRGWITWVGLSLTMSSAVACSDAGSSSDAGGESADSAGGASPASRGAGTGAAGAGGNASGGGAASGGGTSEPPAIAPADCENPSWKDEDFTTVIEVGDAHALKDPSAVAWESLAPGTLVKIHARTLPYKDKWVVNAAGTEGAPIVVLGVPAAGVLPVIDGEGAKTRPELNFWNENRAVIKIGASNVPNNDSASFLTIACLDIRGASPENSFTDSDGAAQTYVDSAAAITVEQGTEITIENSVLRDSGNGLFTTSLTSAVHVRGNWIVNNGVVDSIYQHNSYTESLGITFEFNRYGSLCAGCLGNNLKDRSAGTTIRYNWIENGNRQLDLVDSDHAELLEHASYGETFIYGNVLIEGDGEGNGQIIHYGGDSGEEANYRKGTLHLYLNTIYSTRSGNTTLLRLSSSGETVSAFNNIFHGTAAGTSFALLGTDGTAEFGFNFFPTGFRQSHDTFTGTLNVHDTVGAAAPGFVDAATQDFALASDSICRGAGSTLDSVPVAGSQYERHQAGVPRAASTLQDLGAVAD